MTTAGFVKLRRGLLEHLPRLSPNAVKLFVFLLLKVKPTGLDQGVYRSTTRELSEDLGMRREGLMAAVRELEELQPRPFIEVNRAANQSRLTEFRVLRFDSSAGPESVPAPTNSAGPKSGPATGPATGPADHPKQLRINGLASPDTEETEENTNGVCFQRGKDGSYPTWFERLWILYPSEKGAKKTGFDKAVKAVRSTADIEIAIRYLEARQAAMSEKRRRGEFVPNLPHVERYFSKGLWSQPPEIPQASENPLVMAWGEVRTL